MRIFFGITNKTRDRWAYVVSRIFDPVLLIPLMLVAAAWGAYVNGTRVKFLSSLVFLDAVLPGFVFVYYLKKGKISGWDIRKRQERVKLFAFVCLAHFLGVAGAWILDRHPVAEYLTSFWVMTVIFWLVTMRWKISVHAGVMSALSTFAVLVYGKSFVWLYGLVMLVAWARVEGQYHRVSQVLAGAVVPMVVIPAMFWFLGV